MTTHRGHSMAGVGSHPDQSRLADHIDHVVATNGVAGGLRPALRAALLDCPRHLFVGRYQLHPAGPVFDRAVGNPERHFDVIYKDIALGHVDAAGRALPSTNSPPSASLYLLELLDLQPGQTVLEVGSGSGWALALMARAVGPAGRVIGIEILPDLAEQSRRSLAAAGIANATVVSADGAAGFAADAPYDRVIFTAGIWSLPVPFFDQVKAGGRLIAPFRIKGPGVDVMVLTREADGGFRATRSMPSFFVSGAGGLGIDAPPRLKLRDHALWRSLADRVSVRVRMPLGMLSLGTARGTLFGASTTAFRSFLTKTEPGLIVFSAEDDDLLPPFQVLGDPGGAIDIGAFGIVDEAAQSLAVCTPGELVGYGGKSAAHRLLKAYADWADLMMPGAEAFDAALVRAQDAPAPDQGHWIEQRGGTSFVWSLRPDWARVSDILPG